MAAGVLALVLRCFVAFDLGDLDEGGWLQLYQISVDRSSNNLSTESLFAISS